MKSFALLLVSIGTFLFSIPTCQSKQPDARSFNIINLSGKKIEVFWLHPDTGETVSQSNGAVHAGATFSLNSYVGHDFEIREVPSKKSKKCGDESNDNVCRSAYFEVNSNDDQKLTLNESFELLHEDNKTAARDSASDILKECETLGVVEAESGRLDHKELVTFMSNCVSKGLVVELERASEEVTFQANIRRNIGALFENYTCADEDLGTTDPQHETFWSYDGKQYPVKVMIDRPASKVHLIDNFITPEQCEAMEVKAKATLHRATVADGKGGSELSPSRKAMQSGISIPWHLESEGNPLTKISRKVYDYTNHVLGLDIDEHGQEDLMSIQYFGRGPEEKEPDRYTPHCDGDCTGLEFKPGNRMATVVMYCDIPERGGATNFRNSGIHVVPKPGSATFFSYIDPHTMKMDTGFTEHSGCPVIEGSKKIVTQWIRLGVDAENPWDSFNTLGLKIADLDED
mmetsp:Transcript_1610/g.2286  ORF Transcript_1610/g.2286 Transcript_1610/m.2286 type:complete len:459 (+) Transcript_1610:46-1422(+)